MRFIAILAFLIATFAAACGDDDQDSATPTAGLTATATSTATPTRTPAPSHSPTPIAGAPVRVPSVVELVAGETGEGTRLYESLDERAFLAQFADPGIWLRTGQEWMAFDLEGNPVPAGEGPEFPYGACRQAPDGEVCGVISPDGRWLLYEVDAGTTTSPGGATVPVSDQWVLNVQSGAGRLIQPGMVHCGGCDGGYGPRWSASGRFVVFAETGGEGRRWITDVATGLTNQIGTGQGIGVAPNWSPTTDQLLYNSPQDGTILLDIASGSTTELSLPWPAAFDASGEYAYSPSWYFHVDDDKDPAAPKPRTTIVDTASGAVVDTLAGAPPYAYLWDEGAAVATTNRGLVVVLQGAEDCDGTAIYLDGDLDRCIEGGVEARIGRGGLIAVARDTGPMGNIQFPGGGSLESREFAVDIVHPDGAVETVVEGAYGLDAAPGMLWNDAGTHLLVHWPRFIGL